MKIYIIVDNLPMPIHHSKVVIDEMNPEEVSDYIVGFFKISMGICIINQMII